MKKDFSDIDTIINMDEGKTFDRKSAKYDKRKLANILIAFANADGGTVAIGIDDKKIEGLNILSSQKKNDFLQVGSKLIVPTLDVESKFVDVKNENDENDQILLLTVHPSDNHLYKNKKDEVYLRLGDETHKATFDERKRLEYDKDIRAYESNAVKNAIIDDLDPETVEEYKKINKFDGDNIWDLLFARGLAKRIINKDGEARYYLTVAGVLLLAKIPTAFVPGARIRFIRYDGRKAEVGTKMNVIKQITIEGPLNKMIAKASEELENQLRDFSSLNIKTGKFIKVPEYPKPAWLEGIVNAVTHRGYNYTGNDVMIKMFDDHLEISSPGGLPSFVTTDNIRKTHYSRNPYIARALSQFGWVKEFGEGVERIYRDMNDFFLDDPIYDVSNNEVCLILKNNVVTRNNRKNEDLESRLGDYWSELSELEHLAVSIAYERGSVKTKELHDESIASLSASRTALRRLTKLGIFKKVASSPTAPNQYYKLIK